MSGDVIRSSGGKWTEPGRNKPLSWNVFTEIGQWKGKRRARRHSGKRMFKMFKKKTFPSRRAESLYLFSLSQLSVILPVRTISSSPLARSAATQHIIVSQRKEAASNQKNEPTSRPFFQQESSRNRPAEKFSSRISSIFFFFFGCFFFEQTTHTYVPGRNRIQPHVTMEADCSIWNPPRGTEGFNLWQNRRDICSCDDQSGALIQTTFRSLHSQTLMQTVTFTKICQALIGLQGTAARGWRRGRGRGEGGVGSDRGGTMKMRKWIWRFWFYQIGNRVVSAITMIALHVSVFNILMHMRTKLPITVYIDNISNTNLQWKEKRTSWKQWRHNDSDLRRESSAINGLVLPSPPLRPNTPSGWANRWAAHRFVATRCPFRHQVWQVCVP